MALLSYSDTFTSSLCVFEMAKRFLLSKASLNLIKPYYDLLKNEKLQVDYDINNYEFINLGPGV